jgi:hypothetical protein
VDLRTWQNVVTEFVIVEGPSPKDIHRRLRSGAVTWMLGSSFEERQTGPQRPSSDGSKTGL